MRCLRDHLVCAVGLAVITIVSVYFATETRQKAETSTSGVGAKAAAA